MNKIKSIISTTSLALCCLTSVAQSNMPYNGLETHRGPQALKAIGTTSKRPQAVKVLKVSKHKASATQSPFYGRTFHGSLINSTDWANSSITNVPYGIYSFELNDDIKPQAQTTNMLYNFESGAYTGGEFFGIYAMEVMGGLNGARYITLDTDTWKEKSQVVHDASEGSYSLLSASMAYNYIDNNIYSFQYNDNLTGLNWCKFNTQYQAMDKLAAFRGQYNILAMATTPDGEMYFINAYGDLYKVNKKTGRPSLIAWTGVNPILYTQSMMYDNRTGLFLWAAMTDNGSELYSVDPSTAETTFLAAFKKQEQFSALYCLDEGAKDGAPAKAEDLKLVFAQDGGLNGNITFNVPTTTFDGKSLGNSLLNVWLDGQNLKGVTAQAGEKVNIPVDLNEGNHYVAVNMKNENGWSPLASLKQYAGYDTPVAIKEVKFVNENGKNTISWEKPTEGVNKGYIDVDNEKYTIVRMPDSVTVAKNYDGTTFDEATPAAMHNYSYRVYAINNGKTGAYTESNKITCGDAFTVPYSQGFDSEASFNDYFTVIDNNNDGATWKYQNSDHIVRFDLIQETGDDWLITPAIKLEGGKNYKFTINLKTFTKGYPEFFEILVGTDPHDVSTFKSIKEEKNFELYEAYSDYSVTFNIEKSQKYYIALRYLGEKEKNSTMLLVKKFSVTEIGETKAPAAATGLKIVPGENDAMEATISLTTPGKDLNGNDINCLSKVNVYRNGDKTPIHTFEAPAVNTELTWTDKKVSKTGMNIYTIKAENEFGEGAAISDSAFVGCYTAPYSETFDTRASAKYYTTYMEGIDLEKNPNYQWEYSDYNHDMTIYCFNAEADHTVSSWLITPLIKLDANSVYTLSYKKKYSTYTNTVTGNVYMGKNTTIDAQNTLLGALEKNVGWGMEDANNTVVTKDAGKYCFGFNIKSTAQYDNIMADIDDVTLTYAKSALSPYAITDYKAMPDPNGELKCQMSFKAPAVDYQGNQLSDNLTINIYRGNNTIPVYTATDVIPGAEIKWTDTQAIQGQNKYTIIASNQYGRSEIFTYSLFVGIDRPSTVENLTIKGSKDNMTAVISWEAPSKGHNGGVVPTEGQTYRILQYDPTEQILSIVADDVKELTYSISKPELKKQEILYYGVVAKNKAGIGDTLVSNCVIGKLYDIPFKESFANKETSTSPWIISTENSNYLNWGADEPAGAYNNATPEDNDGGCAYFYNGSYYETYAGAGFISPKIALNGDKNYLSFWVYNYVAKYSKLPYVLVYARVDDGQFKEIGRYQVAEKDGEEGWKKYTIDLSNFKDNNFISFGFYGYTAGYQECIYLDNINVGDETTGINQTEANDKDIERINWYSLDGRSVIAPNKGVFIKTITYTDGSKKSMKVAK